jgi:NitT/TauT family transport system substrate-binding protein
MKQQHLSQWRLSSLAALLAVAVMILAGCGAGGQVAATATPRTPISVQLSWVHEYSSAAFYAAEKNGHFAGQNLDVRLVEGGFGSEGYIDPVEQVLNGTVDFGMTNASSIITARAAGLPVVAVASVLQRSPLAIISLEESGIQRPQDLIGRRVAVAKDGSTQSYNTLLASQQIDPAQVNTVARTSFGVEPLINHEVDAMVAWAINEGVQVREAGYTPRVIMTSDYGVDTYDFLIFTTEQTVAERPELVERFLRAVTQGVQEVMDKPDQAASLALAYNSKLDIEGQRQRLQALLPLMKPAGSRPGDMDPQVWNMTHQMMLDQGGLKSAIDLRKAYTLAFIEKLYAK